jgi:hypothetical protein
MEYNPVDLAFMAGLFEGEGSVLCAKDSRWNGVCLSTRLTNTKKEMIRWIVARFQGRLRERLTQFGHNPNHKLAYQWEAYGPEAYGVLCLLRPFLKWKIKHAELGLQALKIQALRRGAGRRDHTSQDAKNLDRIFRKLRQLNQRGTKPLK